MNHITINTNASTNIIATVIEVLKIADPKTQSSITTQKPVINSSSRLSKKPRIKLIKDLQLKKGDILVSIHNQSMVEIVSDFDVKDSNGDMMSLSRATQNVMRQMNRKVHNGYRGITHWSYNGVLLHTRGIDLGVV